MKNILNLRYVIAGSMILGFKVFAYQFVPYHLSSYYYQNLITTGLEFWQDTTIPFPISYCMKTISGFSQY